MKYVIIIIVVIVVISIFLLLREFWCWYWKINRRVDTLEKINMNLEEMKALLIHQNQIYANISQDSDENLPEL